ncbi:MAG TPA: response regulator, partial [Thermoanaerobaculia bacterium]|nr:response regulator [Thermoanaerobaculia bacterium]
MPPPERRLRVLLLDDDPDDRALVKLVLARELPEAEVEEAAGAAAFARACGRRSFDLVILERRLPWADGLDLLALFREEWPQVPVIVLTGPGGEEDVLKAARLGVADYLIKKPAGFLKLPLAVRTARAGGLAEDVTARRQEETLRRSMHLQRANEELRQFTSIASHELQEPVRMMERYARLLAEELEGKLDAGGAELLEIITAAARRLRRLIESLLALSRADSRELRIETVGAATVLERALANLQEMIEESGATIERSPLPEIEGDSQLIAQVFENLLSNAIKFRGAEPPRVHVSAERGPREWIFAVRDNGRGLPPAEAESVFTIFKRLHPEVPGSGIGLALCRKIVERH